MDKTQEQVPTLLVDTAPGEPLVVEHYLFNGDIRVSIAAALNCQRIGGLHGVLPDGDVLWLDLQDTAPDQVLNFAALAALMDERRTLITGPVYRDDDGYHVKPPTMSAETVAAAHALSLLRVLDTLLH